MGWESAEVFGGQREVGEQPVCGHEGCCVGVRGPQKLEVSSPVVTESADFPVLGNLSSFQRDAGAVVAQHRLGMVNGWYWETLNALEVAVPAVVGVPRCGAVVRPH